MSELASFGKKIVSGKLLEVHSPRHCNVHVRLRNGVHSGVGNRSSQNEVPKIPEKDASDFVTGADNMTVDKILSHVNHSTHVWYRSHSSSVIR
jgi:hypothetical protein